MGDSVRADLAGLEILGALGPAERERLSSLFMPRSFPKDALIFSKGDPGLGLYVIRGGEVKICVFDRNGAELIFTFLSKGDLLGEMAILDDQPRSATAIAVARTDTWYLERARFQEFLTASNQACIAIISMLCQRVRRLSTQMEERSFLDVSGRIARKLVEMSTGGSPDAAAASTPTFETSQEELATTIGASRVMVNKVLNSFVDLGLITVGRKKLTVLDASQLARIAEYDAES